MSSSSSSSMNGVQRNRCCCRWIRRRSWYTEITAAAPPNYLMLVIMMAILLNGTNGGSLRNVTQKQPLKLTRMHVYTADDLLTGRFAFKVSDDIDMDPCKSGNNVPSSANITCLLYLFFVEVLCPWYYKQIYYVNTCCATSHSQFTTHLRACPFYQILDFFFYTHFSLLV